ncbi:MAG: RsbRD N-terminal domain-containing protein [bacterium]
MHLILKQKQTEIIQKWFKAAISSYVPESRNFLQNQKDQFSNPVGCTTREGLGLLFGEMFNGMNMEKIRNHLEPIIKIRAVQIESPAQALDFIFYLKKILIEELSELLDNRDHFMEFLKIESRIDKLGQIAFNIYSECKTKLYTINMENQTRRIAVLLTKAGYISAFDKNEIPGQNEEAPPDS